MVCFANKIITVQTIQLAGETKKIVKNLKRNRLLVPIRKEFEEKWVPNRKIIHY